MKGSLPLVNDQIHHLAYSSFPFVWGHLNSTPLKISIIQYHVTNFYPAPPAVSYYIFQAITDLSTTLD